MRAKGESTPSRSRSKRGINSLPLQEQKGNQLPPVPGAKGESTPSSRSRSKRGINSLLPVPRTNELQFIIPQEYCATTEGDQFLQVNNFANGIRMLIYGSQRDMHFMSNCDHWYMDGTFNTLPSQFLQLYTIHGIKNGTNVIGLSALVTNKRRVTYEEMFQHIKSFIGNATPTSINIDFEMAAINACRSEFPLSLLRCCFFHLCQNDFKKVQANNLSNLYNNDVAFRTNIRMILAVAFVPVYDMVRVFTLLSNHCGIREQPIMVVFENNQSRWYSRTTNHGGIREQSITVVFENNQSRWYSRTINHGGIREQPITVVFENNQFYNILKASRGCEREPPIST